MNAVALSYFVTLPCGLTTLRDAFSVWGWSGLLNDKKTHFCLFTFSLPPPVVSVPACQCTRDNNKHLDQNMELCAVCVCGVRGERGCVCSEATQPLISGTDDTLRKPLSRLLSVTVTVIQANMCTYAHTQTSLRHKHSWALLGCDYYQLRCLGFFFFCQLLKFDKCFLQN